MPQPTKPVPVAVVVPESTWWVWTEESISLGGNELTITNVQARDPHEALQKFAAVNRIPVGIKLYVISDDDVLTGDLSVTVDETPKGQRR